MACLYFIRHGETDWNRSGRLQGHTEVALNAHGRRQATAVAAHLLRFAEAGGGQGLNQTPFHASPMLRVRETASILRSALHLEPDDLVLDARLREIGFGAWEGKTWAEIRARDPIGARDRDKDRWNYQPPGGESYAMVAERVGEWLAAIDSDMQAGNICLIAHGGIGRVLLHLIGGRTRESAVETDIWQGKVLRFSDGLAEWLPGPGHH